MYNWLAGEAQRTSHSPQAPTEGRGFVLSCCAAEVAIIFGYSEDILMNSDPPLLSLSLCNVVFSLLAREAVPIYYMTVTLG